MGEACLWDTNPFFTPDLFLCTMFTVGLSKNLNISICYLNHLVVMQFVKSYFAVLNKLKAKCYGPSALNVKHSGKYGKTQSTLFDSKQTFLAISLL